MIHFGGHRFSTYVANDAVFVRQKKVHLDFFFFKILLLVHFKAFFFMMSQQEAFKVTKYAEKTSVF